MPTTLLDRPRSCQHMRNRSCAGTPASAIVSAMILSAVRSFCACLRISTAAAVVIFALGSNVHGAQPAGSIAFVGTDSDIYYCDTKCAQPKCITCKAAAIHVRRDAAIRPVILVDNAPDAAQSPGGTEYGWPTFSP